MKKILIVDDEPMILAMLHQVFVKTGFATKVAKSASEGWTIYNQKPVDLVITDIHMPENSGLDLAAALRRCAFLPLAIIGMSGTPLDRGPHPFDAFFIKPFKLRDVVSKARSLLDQQPAAPSSHQTAPKPAGCLTSLENPF